MIKTAIIGASGFLGCHLINNYRSQYPDCIGTSYSNHSPNLISFDIKSPDIKPLNLERTGHKAVIIASYISKISYCENEPLKACKVNVDGVLQLIKNLSKTSLKIIFYLAIMFLMVLKENLMMIVQRFLVLFMENIKK